MRRHGNPRCKAEVTVVHSCSPGFLTPLPVGLCLTDELSESKAQTLRQVSGCACQLNRWMQHHPVHWFDDACAGEPSVWLCSAKT